jgi:chlorite dismutase
MTNDGESEAVEAPASKVREGIAVLHLFGHTAPDLDLEAAVSAVKEARETGSQVMTVATIGHRSELAVMALDSDAMKLRDLQVKLARAGVVYSDSFFSITEISEYAHKVPEQHKQARLYPKLPPEGKEAWCFYPMAKRRNVGQNWYALDYEERKRLMYQHGDTGRKFSDRILQLVTGSTGLSDWEWGVTLFASRIDDIKSVVYEMRYDEASTHFAEFGPFYVGILEEPESVFGGRPS